MWQSLLCVLLPLCSFNPHTHEGCDILKEPEREVLIVSIHTPTKGVTRQKSSNVRNQKFQSTHPRRVWPKLDRVICFLVSFNPHTHEGCDWRFAVRATYRWSFNPHTHEGCDSRIASSLVGNQFQSTHPRRVWRLFLIVRLRLIKCFNPHTHEGCDLSRQIWIGYLASFNPHTHEGCDHSCIQCRVAAQVSIHTPTKGVTFRGSYS